MDLFKRQWAFFDADGGDGGGGGDGGTDGDTGGDGGDTGNGDQWYSSYDLTDEQKGHIQNRKWESPAGIIDSYTALEKLKGANENSLIKVPEDPDSEEWGALYSRLGRPETAAEYGLEMPEGMEAAESLKTGFEEDAHANGLNPAQTKALFDGYNTRNAELAAEILAEKTLQQETEIAELQKKWGDKGFSEREDMARRMFRSLGVTDEDSTKVEQIVGSAGLIEMFANIYEKTQGKDPFVNGDGGGDTGYGSTIEQVRAKKEMLLAEIGADPKRNADYIAGKGPDKIKMDGYYKRLEAETAKA